MFEEKALSLLFRAVDGGRMHHAVLLSGPDVSVLESVAEKTASHIFGANCRNPPHPDLFELRPEGRGRQIKIGQIKDKGTDKWLNTVRWLIGEIHLTSSLGGAKVAVVYEADRMDSDSSNAFLKTLEEPPLGSFIFLLTTNPGSLLPAVRSRCVSLRIDCPAPVSVPDKGWLNWMEKFKNWQKSAVSGKAVKSRADGTDAFMRCYALLAEFDAILKRVTGAETDKAASVAVEKLRGVGGAVAAEKSATPPGGKREKKDGEDVLSKDELDALKASISKKFVGKMLSDMEDAVASCAVESGGGSALKLSRAVDVLERSARLTGVLHMGAAAALEYFMLSSLRIWSRP